MHITRRQALIGAAAGIALPLGATARPISRSPLLTMFADTASMTRIDFMQIHEPPPHPPLFYDPLGHVYWMDQLYRFYADHATTIAVSSADGVSVRSVEQAEDILLRGLPVHTATCYPQIGPPPTFVGEEAVPLAILLNQCRGLIHARTRLVYGDTILLSAKALARINPVDGFQPILPEQRRGRWREVGRLNNTMRVFVGDHLADDQVFVAATKDDNHALLIQSASGLHLVTNPGDRAGLPNSLDYFDSVGMSY
jgi:hypothetical protein